MWNQHSIEAIKAARINENIGKPLYESYCFSNIPQLVRHTLTGEGGVGLPESVLGALPRSYNKVILFLLDGFGWRFLSHNAERLPFLKRIVERGVVSKLTTQFPPTTSAHVTTLHSGLSVAESGIFEWFYYEPVVDRIFAPLRFSALREKKSENLQGVIDPDSVFPSQTLYRQLAERGVKSYCFQHSSYAHSPFSSVVSRGSTVVSFRTIPEALVNLTELAHAAKEKTYFCVYFDPIDGISHQYGPGSRQVQTEIESLFGLLENIVQASFEGRLHDTLLLITADHGQAAVSPETAIYLDERLPAIKDWTRANRDGQLIVPAGGPRDMFLYLKEEHLTEAREALSRLLQDRATVYETSALLKEGYFGPNPSQRLLDRLGNLVILTHGEQMVWWRDQGRFELHYKGHHGSLNADEMETLLLASTYA